MDEDENTFAYILPSIISLWELIQIFFIHPSEDITLQIVTIFPFSFAPQIKNFSNFVFFRLNGGKNKGQKIVL